MMCLSCMQRCVHQIQSRLFGPPTSLESRLLSEKWLTESPYPTSNCKLECQGQTSYNFYYSNTSFLPITVHCKLTLTNISMFLHSTVMNKYSQSTTGYHSQYKIPQSTGKQTTTINYRLPQSVKTPTINYRQTTTINYRLPQSVQDITINW